MRKKNKSAPFAAGNTTLIAGGTHVIGDIHFSGNLEVEGQITGDIVAEDGTDARVRILPDGRVAGEVRVPVVVINGHIEGNIFSSDQVELADKAVVEGNLHYVLIEIEKGAQVNGSFVHQATGEQSNVVPLENVTDSSQETPGL
jgi:cytoskeletal protein CcmA (bactofilin family)